MDESLAKPLQERTEAKLRYARIHLDELKAQGLPDGGDFDRAHQESFLFHLLGTVDAFLAELCHYYQIAVSGTVSPGGIRAILKAKGKSSPELDKLYELQQDQTSWYSQAKDMRNHSTHIHGVRREYFLGGKNHQKIKLKHPSTGMLTNEHFIIEFENWINSMESLVFSLRKSAPKRMNDDVISKNCSTSN